MNYIQMVIMIISLDNHMKISFMKNGVEDEM